MYRREDQEKEDIFRNTHSLLIQVPYLSQDLYIKFNIDGGTLASTNLVWLYIKLLRNFSQNDDHHVYIVLLTCECQGVLVMQGWVDVEHMSCEGHPPIKCHLVLHLIPH